MFETSSLEISAHRVRSYQALPASIFIHGLAAAVVVLGALQNVSFPKQAPAMSVAYSLIEAPSPPPPPPPPPAAAPQPTTPTSAAPATVPREEFAPTVIPDQVVPVSALPESASAPLVPGAPAGVEGGVAGGVGNGVVGGVVDGVVGGELPGVIGGVVGGVDDRVVIPRDAPLRMTPLSQTYPVYPEWARIRNIEDQVVVRYVIGKNGRVKEVTILERAHRKIFDDSVLAAIRYWRFRPLIKDGEPKEVVHELTIYYKLDPT